MIASLLKCNRERIEIIIYFPNTVLQLFVFEYMSIILILVFSVVPYTQQQQHLSLQNEVLSRKKQTLEKNFAIP